MPFFPFIRRHPWCVFLILWMLGTAALVYWIFQRPPAEPIIIRGDETGESGGWPLFDHSFHPFYPWLLLSPLVIALCLRFPIGLRRCRISLPLIFVGGAAFVFLSLSFTKYYAKKLPPLTYVSIQAAVVPPGTKSLNDAENRPTIAFTYSYDAEKLSEIMGIELPHFDPPPAESPVGLLRNGNGKKSHNTFNTFLHLGGYVLIAGLAHLGSYSRHIKEREQRHANLSRELTEARLAGLHSQLRPHFLFNALNIIASEVHDKPDDAAKMIVHLSDLLRSSLTLDSSQHLIPLHQELKMLDDYLAIQSRRFGERLTIVRHFDSETLDLPVPPFLLQPIVENALQHGLEPLARPGTLTLSASRHDDDITLTIEDDGIGLDPVPHRSGKKGTGIGLANIRRRLETLFATKFSLQIAPASPAGGTCVTITMPITPLEIP